MKLFERDDRGFCWKKAENILEKRNIFMKHGIDCLKDKPVNGEWADFRQRYLGKK